MPSAQFNSGVEVINFIKSKVKVQKVGGHRDYMATACPGRYFPLEEMKTGDLRVVITDTVVEDTVNELCWRAIVGNRELWMKQGKSDEDLYHLFKKFYSYVRLNGGSVKEPLSVGNIETAVLILGKQGILSATELWKSKAKEEDYYWLLVKMADYIN